MSEILLPLSAKSYYIVNTNKYNSNYDIIWSFKYSISGYNSSSQVGYTTFLTTLTSTAVNGISGGQYLCTKPSEASTNVTILSAGQTISVQPFNIITIAFDSTGMFALSSATRDGVSLPTPNSLVIRDISNKLLCNIPLASTVFAVAPSGSQIIRCIYSNGSNTVNISWKNQTNTTYTTLTSVTLPYRIINTQHADIVSAGISYCSPISSLSSTPCTMIIENMHLEGVRGDNNIEIIAPTPLN